MAEIDHILSEARRIAGQPVGDKLEGKQGEEARSVVLRLLEAAGLDYCEGLRLLGAVEWERWHSGFTAGQRNGLVPVRTKGE